MNIGSLNISIEMIVVIMLIAVILLLVLCIIALFKIRKLHHKYEHFMMDGNAKSLEKVLFDCLDAQKEINEYQETILKDIQTIYDKLSFTVQKVSIHKYDAFGNTGGKLSYSIALLNEKNTGVIITSVHSVEGSYNYAKNIQGGKADVLLTEEEQEALYKACNKK